MAISLLGELERITALLRDEFRVICAYPIGLSCMRVLCRQVQACFRYAAKPVPDRFTGSLCRIALHSLDLRSLYASMYRALVAASAVGRERARAHILGELEQMTTLFRE